MPVQPSSVPLICNEVRRTKSQTHLTGFSLWTTLNNIDWENISRGVKLGIEKALVEM